MRQLATLLLFAIAACGTGSNEESTCGRDTAENRLNLKIVGCVDGRPVYESLGLRDTGPLHDVSPEH